jgi:hypothetical protein
MQDDAIDSHTAATSVYLCMYYSIDQICLFPNFGDHFLLPRNRRQHIIQTTQKSSDIILHSSYTFAVSLGTLLVNLLFSSADARAPGVNEINAFEQMLQIIRYPLRFIKFFIHTGRSYYSTSLHANCQHQRDGDNRDTVRGLFHSDPFDC